MRITLKKIADLVGGQLSGDADTVIEGLAPIEQAGKGQITFLANRKYLRYLKSSQASAVILPAGTKTESPISYIASDDPYFAFMQVAKLFEEEKSKELPKGIHLTAIIGEKTSIGSEITIGPYVVIGNEVNIGDRTVLCAGVAVGDRCEIGSDSLIYPNVVLYKDTKIGSRVVIHSGAVLGSDGFGYAFKNGTYHKIPQIGRVVVEDDVEIGANTTVDRATMGETYIGQGTKIDNLVQIAHNVVIGENVAIAGQAGISGSTKIGRYVKIGGQAGLIGHIEIGEGATLGAQAGVTKSVPPGIIVSGYPARLHSEELKVEAAQLKLPELLRIIRQQNKRLEELETKLASLEKQR